ncbi:hypothetical protein BaRGS_00000571 [Batillaria attramentaria]|uniref:Uncharacterized protein n=1 Tax=Batillaria attramentaria TaxID=370345 RepID=A0ABD0MAB9_9CAEN
MNLVSTNKTVPATRRTQKDCIQGETDEPCGTKLIRSSVRPAPGRKHSKYEPLVFICLRSRSVADRQSRNYVSPNLPSQSCSLAQPVPVNCSSECKANGFLVEGTPATPAVSLFEPSLHFQSRTRGTPNKPCPKGRADCKVELFSESTKSLNAGAPGRDSAARSALVNA